MDCLGVCRLCLILQDAYVVKGQLKKKQWDKFFLEIIQIAAIVSKIGWWVLFVRRG